MQEKHIPVLPVVYCGFPETAPATTPAELDSMPDFSALFLALYHMCTSVSIFGCSSEQEYASERERDSSKDIHPREGLPPLRELRPNSSESMHELQVEVEQNLLSCCMRVPFPAQETRR
jgi:hypothetical protein